jgi:putative addiction module antidote
MHKTKLRAIGSSTGIIIPKEMLDRMNLKEGDTLFVRETREGYVVTPYDAEFERQMESARKGMARYRNTLRALAE